MGAFSFWDGASSDETRTIPQVERSSNESTMKRHWDSYLSRDVLPAQSAVVTAKMDVIESLGRCRFFDRFLPFIAVLGSRLWYFCEIAQATCELARLCKGTTAHSRYACIVHSTIVSDENTPVIRYAKGAGTERTNCTLQILLFQASSLVHSTLTWQRS